MPMTWKRQYLNAKPLFLADATICAPNRALIADFFAFEEYKLKRSNGLSEVDEACCKTLYGYIQRLRNVNRWFDNKPWTELTKDDIKRVYDALEDGTIRTQKGTQFQDRHSYYNKIFKSKPFRLAGKEALAREVIEFSTRPRKPVRYITEETFKRLANAISNPLHLFLLWLAWDIGENIDTLLNLTKRDFIPQTNAHSGEREYLVQLPQAKLKRTRVARSEVTLYRETARYADIVLPRLGPDDCPFTFGYRYSSQVLKRAVTKVGATTMPHDQSVRWKDLRSGMACHLLKNGWTRDEVNARLGHTPSSTTLDAYINFLALDRNGPKQRLSSSHSAPLHCETPNQRPPNNGDQETLLTRELIQAYRELSELRAQVEQLKQAGGHFPLAVRPTAA